MFPLPRLRKGTLIKILATEHTKKVYPGCIGQIGTFIKITVKTESGLIRNLCRVLTNPALYLEDEDYEVIGDPLDYNIGDKVHACTYFTHLQDIEFEITRTSDAYGEYEIQGGGATYYVDKADILPVHLFLKGNNKSKKRLLNL